MCTVLYWSVHAACFWCAQVWWEASDWTGLREMGATKSGTAADGSAWRETWNERLAYTSNALVRVGLLLGPGEGGLLVLARLLHQVFQRKVSACGRLHAVPRCRTQRLNAPLTSGLRMLTR